MFNVLRFKSPNEPLPVYRGINRLIDLNQIWQVKDHVLLLGLLIVSLLTLSLEMYL